MKNKLVLKCNLALGDIVLLTAAVRDLHRCYPGKFATDVRTSFPELWENNPYLTKLREEAYIDIKSGFVDTGASPNQTKPVIVASADGPSSPAKHNKKKKHFLLF